MPYHTDPLLLDELAAAAHNAVDRIIQEYRNVQDSPVHKYADRNTASRIRQRAIPESNPKPIASVADEATDIFQYRMHMNHPRTFSFITAPVSPISWLGDILTSGFNPHAGSWLQSSGPSAVEDELIGWLAEKCGLPMTQAGGLFVSGGSMANLTGLMVARDEKLNQQDYSIGVAYVSTQTHSSVAKALKVLGFKDQNIRKVRTDSNFRMDVDDLRKQIAIDQERSLRPFAVVVSLGTTNTGSVDALSTIGDVAHDHDMWMHVDGAYGAAVVLSKSHTHLAHGLEKADSLSCDAHKWLFQTYDVGVVLVRSKALLLRSFANNAEYLRDALATSQEPNFWNFGPELTRPARAMKLWLTLRTLGTEMVGEMIDQGFMLAEVAEKKLRSMFNWQIVSPAQMAIVNFRYAPSEFSDKEVDQLNKTISRKVLESNTACILTTQLDGVTVLRIVAIHPDLSEGDMIRVIELVDEVASDLTRELRAARQVVARGLQMNFWPPWKES